MIVIIAGGRDYAMDALDWRRLDALHAGELEHLGCHSAPVGPITCVYEGGATGADACGRMWAASRGLPWLTFPYRGEHGRAGGPIRNRAMLAGEHHTGKAAPAELVVAFPGGAGTADMVEAAQEAGVPVLDLRLARAQRWTCDHVDDLRSFTKFFELGRAQDAQRSALGVCALAHGGLGVPCASAHLFRTPGSDRIILPPGALYCGRPGMIGLRNMELPPDGDGSVLGNPVVYKGGVTAEDAELAMAKYRGHLRDIYRDNPKVRELLDRIGRGGTLLVCWCHASKPCHTTVIAEAALLVRARQELRARGLPPPPRASPAPRSRSTVTPPAFAAGLFEGAAS